MTYFDTVSWVTGRPSGCRNVLHHFSIKVLFLEQKEEENCESFKLNHIHVENSE